MNIAIIGRKGSDYRKHVDKWMGHIPLRQAHAVFNYGLQGEKLRDFIERNPRLDALPILNYKQFGNKYECIVAADEAGVDTPDTVKPRNHEWVEGEKWIAKPYYSLGGKDIFRITGPEEVNRRTHYIQKEITNRRYELRCICASWIDPKDWLFQKRVHEGGDAELAWNNHNGGKFITVENANEPIFNRVRKDTIKLLKKLNYQFGAVDYIVQNPGVAGKPLKHYFIEWNLAPGWTMDRTEKWYRNTFDLLKEFPLEDLECFASGMTLQDIEQEAPPEPPNRLYFGGDDAPEPPAPNLNWNEMVAQFNDGDVPDVDHAEVAALHPNQKYPMGQLLPVRDWIANALVAANEGMNYVSVICDCGELFYRHERAMTTFCTKCGREVG